MENYEKMPRIPRKEMKRALNERRKAERAKEKELEYWDGWFQ